MVEKKKPTKEVIKAAPIKKKELKPAMDPEARDKQLTRLAYDLAAKQLQDGTASPSVIGHFLKLASRRENLEQEILEKQMTLIEAKANSIIKDREGENLAKDAIDAMSKYRSTSTEG